MNCPACGQRLQWEDRAFCSTCMEIAEEKIHMSDQQYQDIGTPEDKAIEEVGEFLQAMSKARRFGWLSHHPSTPECLNINNVRAEMEDVRNAFASLDTYLQSIVDRWRRCS